MTIGVVEVEAVVWEAVVEAAAEGVTEVVGGTKLAVIYASQDGTSVDWSHSRRTSTFLILVWPTG